MASTVKVPLIGPVSKGKAAGIMVGGVAVSGYMIWRYEKKAKATAAATAASQQASTANAYGYGSGYGYGQGVYPGGYYGYGENPYGYGAMGQSPGYYGYGSTTGETVPPEAVTTNAQWAQAAINQLTQEGYDAQTVGAALGAYELGQPVSAAQVTIVQNAIGIEGYPPQPGANDYPPNINTQGTGGGGGGGGQPGGTVTVPNVVGMKGEDARKEVQALGLKSSQSPAVPKGKTSSVKSQNPKSGTQAKAGSTVTMVLTIK